MHLSVHIEVFKYMTGKMLFGRSRRGRSYFRRAEGQGQMKGEGQVRAPEIKYFQVKLNIEGKGFFIGIFLSDVGFWKAVVKEKLPRS